MIPLPIPDKQSPIRYEDIDWDGSNLGKVVAALTKGRIPPTHFAHLDPDLNPGSIPRDPAWRPVFGQDGPAQGHLRNKGVASGDLFLFFGLFRQVVDDRVGLTWARGSPSAMCSGDGSRRDPWQPLTTAHRETSDGLATTPTSTAPRRGRTRCTSQLTSRSCPGAPRPGRRWPLPPVPSGAAAHRPKAPAGLATGSYPGGCSPDRKGPR